jgi:beta-galactosidase
VFGKFVWAMFDFASDSRNEGSQPGINDKGLMTRDRTVRKDSFYWYKVNWNPAPMVYLTSRRWTQRTAAVTNVNVYSNASSVTLTLNGVPLGAKPVTDHAAAWPGVTLRPGANTVTATATINGTPVTDTVVWTLS